MARLSALCLALAIGSLLAPVSSAIADAEGDALECRKMVFGDRTRFSGQIAGSFDETISTCTKAVESGDLPDKRLAEAFTGRALAYGTRNQYERAMADFDQALRLDPTLADAYFGRGTAHAHLGEFERAIGDFDKAIQFAPDYTLTYSSRGNSYARMGDYQRAIADFNEAIRINPNDSWALENRARSFFWMEQFSLAAEDFSVTLSRNPAEPYNVLWLYLARQRGSQDGLDALRQNATGLNLANWPGPIVRMYLREIEPGEAGRIANNADPRIHAEQWCEVDFYYAEMLIAGKSDNREQIIKSLRRAAERCPTYFMESIGAQNELARLGESP